MTWSCTTLLILYAIVGITAWRQVVYPKNDATQISRIDSLLQTDDETRLIPYSIEENNLEQNDDNQITDSGMTPCKTTKGICCHFPFTYKKIEHRSCTTAGGYKTPWCYTSPTGSTWGYCSKECATTRSKVSKCTRTVNGNAGGACCHFPFKYKGVKYTSCTTTGHGKPWCYTNAACTKWGECVLGMKTCINKAASEVSTVFTTTKNAMKKTPPRTPGDLIYYSRYPPPRILVIIKHAENFQLSIKIARKTMTKVSMRDIQEAHEESHCEEHTESVTCSGFDKKYRRIDGKCNNLQKTTQGASETPLSRALPADYEDCESDPIGWNNPTIVPSPREVSSKVISIRKKDVDLSEKLTHMVMQFGQFLDHDLGLTAEGQKASSCEESCKNEGFCFPIKVPPNDRRIKKPCLGFTRSAAACGPKGTTVRQQLNELTSYIDASNVYGSNKEVEDKVRDLSNEKGLLKVGKPATNGRFFLPEAEVNDTECMFVEGKQKRPPCFLAGDRRVNENLGLIPIHTIWMRQHNRIATQLREYNSDWNGDKIYQEARKIVGAQMQHIVYTEWLPKVIGEKGMKQLGDFEGYKDNVDASIFNSFTTAALRFGHSTIQPVLSRLNAHFKPIKQGNLPLHESFFAPQKLIEEGGIDPLLRGLFATPAQREKGLNEDLTERLFEMTQKVALDLASLNIQRGRDHGLPSYNQWRQFCGISVAKNFEDLRNEIKDRNIRRKLEELYSNVEHIDLFVGGILEDILDGARVGPTFRCLIMKQFKRLRDGDRFFYENQDMFSHQQLKEIKKTTLASIICDNGDNIQKVQRDVFKFVTETKDYISCSRHPKPDFKFWIPCLHTTGGTANGGCCHFPFTARDGKHTKACSADRNGGVPWCYTNKKQSKWGNCVLDCLRTTGGNAKGACCHFPFNRNGIVHTRTCSTDGNGGTPWCYTNAAKNEWGNCVFDCIPKYGPKAGNKCVFPFTYKGKTCKGPQCCNLSNNPKGSWCSTKVDKNGVHVTGNYAYCKFSPCEPKDFSNYYYTASHCWRRCGGGGGNCLTGYCGPSGYCCKKRYDTLYKKCPPQLLPLMDTIHHTCIRFKNKCIRTVKGNAGGACCHFPFKFEDMEHTSCITAGHEKPWCYTNAERTKWGECVGVGVRDAKQEEIPYEKEPEVYHSDAQTTL